MSTPRINTKYREFNETLLSGLSFFNNNNYKFSLTEFRETGEAFMKILIYQKWGDDIGHGIIIGLLDFDGNENGNGENLSYAEMLSISQNASLVDSEIIIALQTLKRTNSAVHNSNNGKVDYKKFARDCFEPIKKLSKYLLEKFSFQQTEEIKSAFQGDNLAGSNSGLANDPWNEICNITENFSKEYRYILISPPNFSISDKGQLELLSRVDWSFILDFDPNTKENGLYSSFGQSDFRSLINITIKNRGQKNLVGNGGPGSTNWLYGNGISSISDTVAKNLAAWRSLKYHFFIKEIMQDFFSREVHSYIFIYLWDDSDYIDELFKIWDNVNLQEGLAKHVFLTTKNSKIEKIHNLKDIGHNVEILNLNPVSFIGNLQEILNPLEGNTQRYLVPGRTKQQTNDTIDITSIYHSLADDGINVVHQSIYSEKPNLDNQDKIPAFLNGEDINWYDLVNESDVTRYRYKELYSAIRSLLANTKKSRKFDILHKPGAGGTVIGRRLGFDLRNQFPVILISRNSTRLFEPLSTFLDKVNQTVLAIVEASMVDSANLTELIRVCNSKRLNVVFVYIKRTLKVEPSKDHTFFLNDEMADREEMERFLNLVKLYTQGKKTSDFFSLSRQPSDFEVIDFLLRINEKEFNNEKLNQYVGAYIDKMPENHVDFLVNVCFVYYYSQKSVSHHIFRTLFKKSLTSELKHIKQNEQYIRKILTQSFDNLKQEHTEYWRPRFSKFALAVLSNVLGKGKMDQWKDYIDTQAIKFIRAFRSDNDYLVDETRDMLKAVFFERDDDGYENGEQTVSSTDVKFSKLMSDIIDTIRQKEVLEALLEAYPKESHFQGQLGRFIFEKASDQHDFIEAEGLIDDALTSAEGYGDFNLHHIAGMCKSKEIKFHFRKFRDTGISNITESRLKELTENGSNHFSESIRLNNYNVHGYVAHLQMLMDVIDFGRELSGIENRWNFLTASNNRWYMDKYMDIQGLIEITTSLVENEETLGLSRRIAKTISYLKHGEARTFEIIGNFTLSIDKYRSMIDSVERGYRPHIRIMTVYAILKSKVSGSHKRIDDAWKLLNTGEAKEIQKLLNDNILQDPNKILSFKLWFKLLRLSNIDIPNQEIISNLRSWFDHAGDSKILKTEAAFYLYVLYSIDLISAGDSFSISVRAECEYYLEQCRINSFNKKHVFEHLGYGSGLNGLISNRKYKETDKDSFKRVEGVISTISARQEGTITLKCGLTAFFVPVEGNFIKKQDSTVDVTFTIGFRAEGLVAYDVKRKSENSDDELIPISEIVDDETMEPIEQLEADIVKQSELEEQQDPIIVKPQLEGLKVKGKIDLNAINYSKSRKKK